MNIRQGLPAHIAPLVALDDIALRDPGRVRYITDAVHSKSLFVAERNGKVAGYAVLTHSFYGNGMLELVYVAADARRAGVGRALVAYAERLCKTAKLFTSTNASNKSMQLLLEGHGYRLSGYIDNLDPGDTELVYFKTLSGAESSKQVDSAADLPKKRMAVGALFLNAKHEVLIVKPSYRAEWLVPGGVVEADESPHAACIREVREEIGIDVTPGQILCLDYGTADTGRTESLHFVFFGGRLTAGEVARIRLARQEITEYRFVSPDVALEKLAPRLARRTGLALKALEENRMIYAENGVALKTRLR